jgi:RNA polymerase sigma-70 factor (ECF subfamily)
MEDEARLVECARHDAEAFVLLYDRYVERIYAYAQRETGDVALAQDIVSATFEKALVNLPGYRWRGVSFGAWLYKIARNEIHMQRRKQKWTIPLVDRFFSNVNVEKWLQTEEQANEIQQALARLSGRDQEVLRLAFYEELSHAEIGQILNCSPRNVAVRLHRALKRLRKQMMAETQEVIFDVSS